MENNPNDNLIEKKLREFDEKFGSIHKDRPMPSGLETQQNIKNFLKQALASAITQDRKNQKDKITARIEKIKEAVQQQTGSFKYDSCYEDCIEVVADSLTIINKDYQNN